MLHALPFVFGANVGTTITALLSSIKSNRAARRCALVHLFLKLSAAIVCMFLIMPLARATVILSPGGESIRVIANSHTLFNVLNMLVFLPFTRQIATLAIRLFPDTEEKVVFPELRSIDYEAGDMQILRSKLANALAGGIGMVKKAIEHVSIQFSELEWKRLEDIAAEDEELDRGYKEIRNCCSLLYRLPARASNRETFMTIIRFAEILERLGDDITRSTIRILMKMRAESLAFSFSSVAELQALMKRFIAILEEVTLMIRGTPRLRPDEIANLVQAARDKLQAMRKAHFQSMTDNIPSEVSSSTHYIDILSELESSVNKLDTLVSLSETISS